MERYCSTGQSPQWAVAPTEEEEEEEEKRGHEISCLLTVSKLVCRITLRFMLNFKIFFLQLLQR